MMKKNPVASSHAGPDERESTSPKWRWRGWKRWMTPSIERQMEGWNDEELLKNIAKLFTRAKIRTKFIQQQDDNGWVVAERVEVYCGEAYMSTAPIPLIWPMVPVEIPEEYKEESKRYFN